MEAAISQSQCEGDTAHIAALLAACDIVDDTIRRCSEGMAMEEIVPMALRTIRAWAESPSAWTAREIARLGETIMDRAISEPTMDFPHFYCLLSVAWVAMATHDRKVLMDAVKAAAEAVACTGTEPFLEAQERFASIIRARLGSWEGHDSHLG